MTDFDNKSEIMEAKRLEGRAICEKYVCGIVPLEEVASFLGVGIDAMRAAVQQNSLPFAMPYKAGMSDQGRCIITALRLWDWINCKL